MILIGLVILFTVMWRTKMFTFVQVKPVRQRTLHSGHIYWVWDPRLSRYETYATNSAKSEFWQVNGYVYLGKPIFYPLLESFVFGLVTGAAVYNVLHFLIDLIKQT